MSVNDHRTAPATVLFETQQGTSQKSATFVFGNEDHTLGNSLRHILISNTDKTDFCGYSVPHPYDPKMNIRLQTTEGNTAVDVLKLGLKDLEETANCIDDEFTRALKRFQTK